MGRPNAGALLDFGGVLSLSGPSSDPWPGQSGLRPLWGADNQPRASFWTSGFFGAEGKNQGAGGTRLRGW